eukprot:10725045-Heterocapsa_arctica.AAC.1
MDIPLAVQWPLLFSAHQAEWDRSRRLEEQTGNLLHSNVPRVLALAPPNGPVASLPPALDASSLAVPDRTRRM